MLLRTKPSDCQDSADVKSACEAHTEWESGAELRAMQSLIALPQAVLSQQDTPPAISIDELWHSQERDPVIREVLRVCTEASCHLDEKEAS